MPSPYKKPWSKTEIRASSAGINCPSTYTCMMSSSLRKTLVATMNATFTAPWPRYARPCAAALAAVWDTATLAPHAQKDHVVVAVAYDCAVWLRPRRRRVRAADSILGQPGNRDQVSRSPDSRQTPAAQ